MKTEVVSIEELINTIINKNEKITSLEDENRYLKEKIDALIRQ